MKRNANNPQQQHQQNQSSAVTSQKEEQSNDKKEGPFEESDHMSQLPLTDRSDQLPQRQQADQKQQADIPSTEGAAPQRPHAYALYDFKSSETNDLNFKKGDLILLKRKLDANWYVGQCNGVEGTFPINYVQVIVPLPVPQCTALYDFKMGPQEEEGCLAFKKGAVIHVLRGVDENWAEGRIDQMIGIFPIAFVELNFLAKKLLGITQSPAAMLSTHSQVQYPCAGEPRSESTSRASPSVSMAAGEAITTPMSSLSNMPTPVLRNGSSSKSEATGASSVRYRNNKDKRHSLYNLISAPSLTSDSHPAGSVLQSKRYSAEILSAPDDNLTNSDARRQDYCLPKPQNLQTTGEQQQLATALNKPTQPLRPYLALYAYKPINSDELELKKGGVYMVTEKRVDGWYKGKDWQERQGIFPGNYVVPLRMQAQEQLGHQANVSVQCQQAEKPPAPDLPPRSNVAANVGELLHLTQPYFVKTGVSNTTASGSNNESSNREKKDSSMALSLMKRLTHIKSRTKSPSGIVKAQCLEMPVTPKNTFESENRQAQPTLPLASGTNVQPHPIHVRSGSCPSEILQTTSAQVPHNSHVHGDHLNRLQKQERCAFPTNTHMPLQWLNNFDQRAVGNNFTQATQARMCKVGNHRKSESLDGNILLGIPSSALESSAQYVDAAVRASATTKSSQAKESRVRCIVPYPPNSDVELELQVGDIIYVQRNQKNGWYKGTHARTQKTGLFPASFVEPDP